MHLIEPIRSCIDDIIQATGVGLKSLILDDFTTGIVSAGYTRSEMLLREVYVFECITGIFDTSERLNHMKCIVILRPSKENIELLCRELNRPHYRTYHIYFTCRTGPTLVKKIAEADETEVVRCIKDLPLDYLPLTPYLFNFKLNNKTFDLKKDTWLPEGLKRSSDGLASVLITLQIRPLIRYQTHSLQCKALAERTNSILKSEATANRKWAEAAPLDAKSLLLIIDRRNDLITPIVNKWTYYAMIHEQFDIVNNRIDLSDVPNRQAKDPKEMLISAENDEFFEENYYKNYGELGLTLKESVQNLKAHTKSQHKVESMDDMKRFIDEYPETRRYASNLHNHVFLMSELSRLVKEHNLISVSQCEQELACGLISRGEVLKKIRSLVGSNTIRAIDAVRLVGLYTVCKPDKSALNDLIKLLKNRGDVPNGQVDFIKQLREFSLSKPHNPLDDTVQQVTRMIVQGVKGIENVLTEHRPRLWKILDDLKKGNKLRESDFAFIGDRCRDEVPKRVIVFIVGGITYDEALVADSYNCPRQASSPTSPQQRSNWPATSVDSMRVIVGGTCIHSFKSFIEEVRQATFEGL